MHMCVRVGEDMHLQPAPKSEITLDVKLGVEAKSYADVSRRLLSPAYIACILLNSGHKTVSRMPLKRTVFV